VARENAGWGEAHLGELPESERPLLKEVRLHEPIEVAALFDFGLTPRHLKNSGEVIMSMRPRITAKRHCIGMTGEL
jgi:hypothetical protein